MFKERIAKAEADWIGASGRKRTSREFAEYLGVTEWQLSNWKKGRAPRMESLRVLARRLGEEVYGWAGLGERDVALQRLLQALEPFPEEQQADVLRRAEALIPDDDYRKRKREKSATDPGVAKTEPRGADAG